MSRVILWWTLAASLLPHVTQGAGKAEHVVMIVWDGLRPDFVTEESTPVLHQLARAGAFFRNHHAVFPSATEVNGTALATGGHPERSSVIANREYRPRIQLLKPIGTEALEAVRRGDRLTRGRYLNLRTVAEIVQARGFRTAVAGTKPVALLHDRAERRGRSKASINLFAGNTLPTNSLSRITQLLGPFPAIEKTKVKQDEWTTRALLKGLWEKGVAAFSVLWLAEPDYSQHETGPGSETSLAALQSSDRNLSLVLDELEARGVRDKTDIFVVSDHGFSTVLQNADVEAALKQAGFKASREFKSAPAEDEILVVGNGGSVLLYVIGRDPLLTRRIVGFLQTREFTGVLFTRESIEGAFTLDKARIGGANAPDILLTLRWTGDKSQTGVSGLVFCDDVARKPGQGMHVTLSPFDLHNTLIAEGPDVRRGFVSTLPSGNLDIAPTVLWILGIKPPQPMDGRVLTEALAIEGPPLGAPTSVRFEASRKSGPSVWRQYLQTTELNGVIYIDEGNGSVTPE